MLENRDQSKRDLNEQKERVKIDHKGKPLRVFSTSIGVALAASMLLNPIAHSAEAANANAQQSQPKLVSWSTPQVKKFFNPNLDWNIPLPADLQKNGSSSNNSSSASSGNTVVNNYGFGWSDILLYHMIFNQPHMYSSRGWINTHPVYIPGTRQPYKPKTFSQGHFESRPTTSSRPHTVNSKGTFRSKASSASRGSIGGRSGRFSTRGFGGFGG